MRATHVLLLIVIGSIALAAWEAYAGPLDETRYVTAPVRNADGSIKRRADVIAAFKRAHLCPSTDLPTGPCPGYAIDHVIPLAACGADSVSNMQWLKNETKSCAAPYCKDRYELKINSCPKVAP